MYAFVWRRLPGNTWWKLGQMLALFSVVGALLWFFVFPWAEPLLPFDDVQVGTGTEITQTTGPDNVVPYPTVNNPHPSASELAN
jgi:hypothetical protein